MPCAAPMRATSVDRGLADGRSLFADDGTFECLTNEPLIGDALLFGTLPDSIKEGAGDAQVQGFGLRPQFKMERGEVFGRDVFRQILFKESFRLLIAFEDRQFLAHISVSP